MGSESSTRRGEERFFELVGFGGLSPGASLAQVSGMPAADPPYATDLVRRVEDARATPFRSLSCQQVRLLVGQKMGLQWLGRPALAFAARDPAAAITNYPGEMTLLCLRGRRTGESGRARVRHLARR
jgi:hypothetical protein